MLRPYETDIVPNPVPLIHAISTNAGQAPSPIPMLGEGNRLALNKDL